ncbi:hypothetical protein D3C76_1388060 [compost metagenome]
MHDAAILADITVAEIEVRLAIHDPDNGGSRFRQVVRMHVVGDRGAGQLVRTVTEQRLTGITDKYDLVIPVDHEDRVQHQMDQFGVERLQVNGHRSASPGSCSLIMPDHEGRRLGVRQGFAGPMPT